MEVRNPHTEPVRLPRRAVRRRGPRRPTPIRISPTTWRLILFGLAALLMLVLWAAPIVPAVALAGFGVALVLSFPVHLFAQVVPRGLAILLSFLILLAVLLLLAYILLPLIVSQAGALVAALPSLVQNLEQYLVRALRALHARDLLPDTPEAVAGRLITDIRDSLGVIADNVLGRTVGIIFGTFSWALTLFAVIFIAASLLSAFEGRRTAQEVQQKEITTAVQVNLAEFVDDAIKTQQEYERMHKSSAKFWYFIGYTALVIGLGTTAYLAYSVIQTSTSQPDYPRAISISLLNVIAIAILAALARYAYSLGKSYISESLKSSDRIHAIQFGKFFLRAYGNKATTAEIREVFQHWNIDRASTFSSLDASQVDPQIVNMVVQLISAVTGKKEK